MSLVLFLHRSLSGCALSTSKQNNSVFQYDPIGGCLTASGAEKVLQISPRQATAKKVWTRKDVSRSKIKIIKR